MAALQSPAAALDALLPGGAGWPPASTAVAPPDLPAEERAWLEAQLAQAPPDWTAHWAAAEAAEPSRFARFLAALYAAYYRTPAVAPRLAVLGGAVPRDTDPHFDPALLQKGPPA